MTNRRRPPSGRTLSDEQVRSIAEQILEELGRPRRRVPEPPKPMHEMSDLERDTYATAAWSAAGIIPDRPNAGRTISKRGRK